MRLVNLTPHDIHIIVDGTSLTIPKTGDLARAKEEVFNEGCIEVEGLQVPVVRKEFGEIINLPAPEEGTIYIVSAIVATAANRDDVVCPGNPVRDESGNIIGCAALCKVG